MSEHTGKAGVNAARRVHLAAIGIACVLVALGVGCASRPAGAGSAGSRGRAFDPMTDASVVAMPSSEQLMLASTAEYLPGAERFEATRRDALAGYAPSVALRATDQWPQMMPPLERPVRFHRWRQR